MDCSLAGRERKSSGFVPFDFRSSLRLSLAGASVSVFVTREVVLAHYKAQLG